nr:MAG TPA: hypothetical protein [Caudoviricetes sp.]
MLGSTIIIFGYFSPASSLSMGMNRRGLGAWPSTSSRTRRVSGVASLVYLKLWSPGRPTQQKYRRNGR